MLAKCTPNYSFDKEDVPIKSNMPVRASNRNGNSLMPKVGAKGNIGSFGNLVNTLRGIQ